MDHDNCQKMPLFVCELLGFVLLTSGPLCSKRRLSSGILLPSGGPKEIAMSGRNIREDRRVKK